MWFMLSGAFWVGVSFRAKLKAGFCHKYWTDIIMLWNAIHSNSKLFKPYGTQKETCMEMIVTKTYNVVINWITKRKKIFTHLFAFQGNFKSSCLIITKGGIKG